MGVLEAGLEVRTLFFSAGGGGGGGLHSIKRSGIDEERCMYRHEMQSV